MNLNKTLSAIKEMPEWPKEINGKGKFDYKSEFVLSELKSFISEDIGYPYNKTVADYIINKNNLQLSEKERSNLETLVYTAQEERRKEVEKAEGWEFFGNIDTTKEINSVWQLKTEGMLGDGYIEGKLIKNSEGKFFLMPKRARKKGYFLYQETKIRKKL